jgi:hypothetical protein
MYLSKRQFVRLLTISILLPLMTGTAAMATESVVLRRRRQRLLRDGRDAARARAPGQPAASGPWSSGRSTPVPPSGSGSAVIKNR